jgi:NADH:ubiquinone reductase (H+-translocating)
VRELREDGTLVLGDGSHLEAGTVIWTAGVKASPAGELLGVELGKGGRVPVDEWLRVPSHPGVYAIGDLAEVQGPEGPHPMLAPVAIQQAAHVAKQISAEVKGQARPGPFRYFDKGTMATIGRNAAIAEIGPLRFTGFIGWVMWLVVHLTQIISFRNRLRVLLSWAYNYVLYDRPVRLIATAKPHAEEPERAPEVARR